MILLCHIQLNAFMIPAQGMHGAAIGTILTEVPITEIFSVYYGRTGLQSIEAPPSESVHP